MRSHTSIGRYRIGNHLVARLTPLALSLALLGLAAAPPASASLTSTCQSSGYGCVEGGYNATTMNSNWATKYYGAGGGLNIGNPPHNCTLYAAWMLAKNGLGDPGTTWGYAKDWGRTLASKTNATPAIGAIAWYPSIGNTGHVAYVAEVNNTNHTVFLESDNYLGGSSGYTSSGWVAATEPSGYIHLKDVVSVPSPPPDPSAYAALTSNADGRLELFAIGTDQKVYGDAETGANLDTWNGWYGIPSGARSISAVTRSDGRIQIFYVGTDGAVYYRYQTAPNSGWGSEHRIGANVLGPIAVARNADGRLELFAIGTDHKVYGDAETGANLDTWNGWYGIPSGAWSIAATTRSDGRIQIAYIGSDGAMYYRYQTAPNSGWGSEHRIQATLRL